MKPFDPRLLRAVPAARRPVVVLAAVGIAQRPGDDRDGLRAVGARRRRRRRHATSPTPLAWLLGARRRAGRARGRRRSGSRPGPASRCRRRCGPRCSRRLGHRRRRRAPRAGAGPSRSRPRGAAPSSRMPPATSRRSCPPPSCRALAVATLVVVDWPSAVDRAADPAAAARLRRPRRPGHRGVDRARSGARWPSLSGHFLDVVRGLPTLVAFGRARRQVATVRRGHRAPPPRHDGHAAASRSCPRPCSSCSPRSRSPWSRSPSACGSPPGRLGLGTGAGRDPAGARGLLAAAPGRRRVPRRRRGRRGPRRRSSPSSTRPRCRAPPARLVDRRAQRTGRSRAARRRLTYAYAGSPAPRRPWPRPRGRPRAHRRDRTVRASASRPCSSSRRAASRPTAGTVERAGRALRDPAARSSRPGRCATRCHSAHPADRRPALGGAARGRRSTGSSPALPGGLAADARRRRLRAVRRAARPAGPRPRLALARRPVLLLDEPTAHLDPRAPSTSPPSSPSSPSAGRRRRHPPRRARRPRRPAPRPAPAPARTRRPMSASTRRVWSARPAAPSAAACSAASATAAGIGPHRDLRLAHRAGHRAARHPHPAHRDRRRARLRHRAAGLPLLASGSRATTPRSAISPSAGRRRTTPSSRSPRPGSGAAAAPTCSPGSSTTSPTSSTPRCGSRCRSSRRPSPVASPSP